MSITGVVLAGGLGGGMGGGDKGLGDFLGKPLIVHVLERLSPQVDEILINANRELDRYSALGYPVIQDDIAGFAGPLAGLHKGMSMAKHPFVLTVPCDSPLLPLTLAERLMQGLIKNGADLAVAKTGAQAHPVFCLCKKTLFKNLEAYLQGGGRKIDAWYRALKMVEVPFDDEPLAFTNVNTAEELLSLEKTA